MPRTKFRIHLSHFSEYRLAARFYEADRNFADVQIKHNFAGLRLAQYERGSQRRMTCKGQLFLHREDAHPHSTLELHRRIIGQNKSCLREIHLPRHRLHLFVAQPSASGKTASGLPSRATEEKTSNCTKGNRRCLLLMPGLL